jgi:S-disulfanyl-L-cysteine oxidoreductase SoxD
MIQRAKRGLRANFAALAKFGPVPFLRIAAALLCFGFFLSAQSAFDGVYTDAQADRGADLYPDECDRCHGMDLEGDEGPALASQEFLADWKGHPLSDLFNRIRYAMPGDHPGKLTARQTADLLAFILRANRFPAGKTELPTDTQKLRQIRLER